MEKKKILIKLSHSTHDAKVFISQKYHYKIDNGAHQAIIAALDAKDSKGNFQYHNRKICRQLVKTQKLSTEELAELNFDSFNKSYPTSVLAFEGNIFFSFKLTLMT
jgi:ssRNA-specific RNase YbeY (16S rRNA maturation enzyme)